MLDYRNILRVASDPHKSMRTMEQELRSSHHTIRKVLDAAEKAGISWPLPETVSNEMLMELLFPEEYQKTALYVLPDYPYIHAELARKGVNMTLLWEEYCTKCNADGTVPYMYTQYCEKYRQWARATKATMRIQHKPGDTMEVDWAGDKLYIVDRDTGEAIYYFNSFVLIHVVTSPGDYHLRIGILDLQQRRYLSLKGLFITDVIRYLDVDFLIALSRHFSFSFIKAKFFILLLSAFPLHF